MSTSRKKKTFNPDSTLITEQPSMAIILTGLVISFFIGFAFKSFFSSARVTQKIAEASQHIHPDIEIRFKSAEVSLSHWGLPQMAVLVHGIEVSSDKVCWASPIVKVDQIRVPFSFWNLIAGKDFTEGVELGEVNVTFRQKPEPCQEVRSLDPATVDSSSVVRVEKKKPKSAAAGTYENSLQYLSVQSLQLNYMPEQRYYTELKNLNLRVLSHQPVKFQLDAKTLILKNEMLGDYLSNAKMHIEFSEEPEKALLIHFFGNFREGYYSLIGNYTFEDQQAHLETELRHIPLGAVLNLLQKYGSSPKELNAKNLWMNLKGSSTFNVNDPAMAPFHISRVAIEGDLLELSAEDVQFRSLKPLTYDPIFIDIKGLNIQKLFEFYGRPHPSKAFGSLGAFKGSAEIRGAENIELTGYLSGLEFIFSNQGNREIQTVNSLFADIKFREGNWLLDLSRIEPQQGRFVGDIHLEADRYLKRVNLKINIDELLLSPAVQKLMTQDGNIGLLQGYATWELEDKKTSGLKGKVKISATKSAGLQFGGAEAELSYLQDEIQMKTKVSELKVSAGGGLEVLKNFYPNQASIDFEKVEGRFLIPSANELKWQGMTGTLQAQRKQQLVTTGGWTSQGELYGEVFSREDKKKTEWMIEGTRKTPQFSPKNTKL